MDHLAILLGTSIALESVGAALVDVPGLALQRVEQLTAESMAGIKAASPDAVIFDMAPSWPDRLVDLMLEPGLLLVGFDIKTKQMVLFTRQSTEFTTVDDFLSVFGAHRFAAAG